MRNIAIIDENFDSNVASAYHLSIQYGERCCSFAVLDTAGMKYIAFKNTWFNDPVSPASRADHIRSLLQGENYLIRQFSTVHFLYLNPVSVLVPAPLFRKDNPQAYFNFSSQIQPTDKIFFRKIPAIDAYTVFPVPEDFCNQVDIMLPDVRIFHQSSPQIQEAMSDSGHTGDPTRVLVCIHAGFADILVIRNGQLLLYNSFTSRNTNDLVFFILYMYEQFSLSQEETPLLLSGFPELFPGAIELLRQYLYRVVTRELPKSFAYSPVFNNLQQHHYSHLFNLARCE